jgi:acyl dehydratase
MFYFDNFKIGDKFTSRPRIVTSTDIDLFTGVTGAVNPLFLSDEEARRRGFEGRIAPGLLVLSIAVGLLYQLGLFDNIIALLGINDLRFTSPVRPGEEVNVECEVSEKKEVKTGGKGIVKLKITCKNITKNSISIEGFITLLYPKKPA